MFALHEFTIVRYDMVMDGKETTVLKNEGVS